MRFMIKAVYNCSKPTRPQFNIHNLLHKLDFIFFNALMAFWYLKAIAIMRMEMRDYSHL